MQDGNVLVYVEVRYRASDRFGGSTASVTAEKRRRLINAAKRYAAERRALRDRPARFDVVAISGPVSTPDLRWIRNAFSAG